MFLIIIIISNIIIEWISHAFFLEVILLELCQYRVDRLTRVSRGHQEFTSHQGLQIVSQILHTLQYKVCPFHATFQRAGGSVISCPEYLLMEYKNGYYHGWNDVMMGHDHTVIVTIRRLRQVTAVCQRLIVVQTQVSVSEPMEYDPPFYAFVGRRGGEYHDGGFPFWSVSKFVLVVVVAKTVQLLKLPWESGTRVPRDRLIYLASPFPRAGIVCHY